MDRRDKVAGKGPMTAAEARAAIDQINRLGEKLSAAFALAEAEWARMEAYPGGVEAFRIDFPEVAAAIYHLRKELQGALRSNQLPEQVKDE